MLWKLTVSSQEVVLLAVTESPRPNGQFVQGAGNKVAFCFVPRGSMEKNIFFLTVPKIQCQGKFQFIRIKKSYVCEEESFLAILKI